MSSIIESTSEDIQTTPTIPEPGQLVQVRRRHWVVSNVQGSSLNNGNDNKQHLVTLTSLDEEALGEELQVVWQLEPGAQVLERAGLPKVNGCDSFEHSEAFLDAVRWGAVTNADRSFLQSPFRSGITIEDYQLDPLVRAIDMTRVNLLIADDVGLGKTIEAGLVIQEMLVRHKARTVLIICPASLQIKWQTEMWEKFGLEFRIVDTDFIKQLRRERGLRANAWTSFPRLISSMDWMKSGEGLRLMKDVLPIKITYPRKFDILLIDEAHNVAPAAAIRYSLESQRTKLIRTLSPHFEHRLFLTATPHNGYQESFTSLLELLDDQRFAKTVLPDEKQLQRVMIRRLKSDIVDADGKPVFPKRVLKVLEVDYSSEEKEIHQLLKEYTESRLNAVKGTRYSYGADFILMLLKKRLFSSPMAFATTLSKHRETLSRRKSTKKNELMDDRILRKAIARTEEEYSDDKLMEEVLDNVVETDAELTIPLDNTQKVLLDKLSAWAERAKNTIDSKATAILKWLESNLKTNGIWNDKRVILFTEYRATQSWLEQILATHGFGSDRLMILNGSIKKDDREKIKAAFQANPSESPVRILLATDSASEGIDLQNYCNYLIHIEISWNPNVMEQRNGRIDRHGQKESEVLIWHPAEKNFQFDAELSDTKFSKLEGDQEYLMRAVLKIHNIRQDLGSVGPVIAKQIEEAMLGKRSDLDTTDAEIRAEKSKKFIVAEKKLKEKIAKLHDRLLEAKTDFHLSPEHIARAVKVGLELAEKPPLRSISMDGIPDGMVFEVPILPGSWGKATAGLEHPHTGKRRPITFDHDLVKNRDDIVLAHLNHKLVQMCLRLLREELWKLDELKKLHRINFKIFDDNEIKHSVCAVWSRLVITGTDNQVLHEEITLSGGELKSNGYSRIPQIGKLESLLNDGKPLKAEKAIIEQVKKLYLTNEESIRLSIDARSKDRIKSLTSSLNIRKENEKKDIVALLDELQKNIFDELAEKKEDQLELELWADEERTQLRRDKYSLEARLARIPQEKEKEIELINRRYSNLSDRTFPVAVVFLLPSSFMEGKDY